MIFCCFYKSILLKWFSVDLILVLISLYSLFDPFIPGDEKFYSFLQKDEDYYLDNKEEFLHSV